jgi:hypothetical protein
MNDLDHDLREMFRRRESDLLGSPTAPPRIERRVRRRQVRTVTLSIGTAIVVLGASLFGYRALTDRTGLNVPADSTTGQITAHASGIVITYPRSWQLTIQQTRVGSLPQNVLTNFPLDPQSKDLCEAMPPTGVLLVISPGLVAPGSGTPSSWPVDLNAKDAPAHCDGNDSGGIGWSVSGRSYGAEAFLGSGAVETDYATLQEAFRGMTFPASDDDVGGTLRGVVLASGEIGDRPWTLGAAPDPTDPSTGPVHLEVATSQGGGGLVGSGSSPLDLSASSDLVATTSVMHGNTFLFGGVTTDVARVAVAPDGADAFDAELIPLPSVLGVKAQAYVAPMLGAPAGTLTTYDSNGNVLTRIRFAPGVSCWPGHPCPGQQTPGGPIARGTTDHVDWQLVEHDGTIDLVDRNGTVLASASGSGDALSVTTTTLGTGDGAATFPFGVAPAGATSVVLFTSGLPSDEQTATLQDGRVIFWGSFSPAAGRGQILAFDSSCHLLGAVDLQTGKPPAQPATTDCQT